MPKEKRAKWLLYVYMAGDNDLEAFALKDILELQKVGSSDEVYVFVQIDRAKGHDATHGDWESTRRYFIHKDEGNTISSVYEDIGETNTGDPAVLADFIQRGAELYPAERHGLVIWNHGTGWKDEDIYSMVEKDRFFTRGRIGTVRTKLRREKSQMSTWRRPRASWIQEYCRLRSRYSLVLRAWVTPSKESRNGAQKS